MALLGPVDAVGDQAPAGLGDVDLETLQQRLARFGELVVEVPARGGEPVVLGAVGVVDTAAAG